jgi:nicotinate-nucleotide adenylyltransferase
MRLGLFGGTFDPVHLGHVALAREAHSAFELDRVLLIPNHRPPHKQTGASASYADRLRMLELACEGEPGLSASRLEEGTERSYTIETLLKVRQELKSGDRLFFLIGADAYAEVGTWYRWKEVLLLTEFIVVTRPGHAIVDVPGATAHRLETVDVPYSSSGIRAALRRGAKAPGLAPDVAGYIESKGLYREVAHHA